MIPRQKGRDAGTGGGGKGPGGAVVPFFCKRCGKTMPLRKAKHAVDVCPKCSVRK